MKNGTGEPGKKCKLVAQAVGGAAKRFSAPSRGNVVVNKHEKSLLARSKPVTLAEYIFALTRILHKARFPDRRHCLSRE